MLVLTTPLHRSAPLIEISLTLPIKVCLNNANQRRVERQNHFSRPTMMVAIVSLDYQWKILHPLL